MLVHVREHAGPDSMVIVHANSEKEAIQRVKDWLIFIDYDPEFPGMHFRADWPDVDSITIIEPIGE